MLFPALLQGDKAVESLLAALKRAAQVAHRFDAVAIIRGGGGDVGLSCFNNFALAHAIATFPIPVYTGIGHATNETVCEMVSYYNGITPSKVAQHLLEQFEAFEANVIQSQHTVTRFARETLAVQTRELHIHSRIIRQTASGILTHHHHRLRSNSEQLQKLSKRFLEGNFKHLQSSAERITVGSTHQLKSSAERVQQSTRQLDTASASALSIKRTSLEHIEHIVSLSDPKKILQRGYSITTINGKSLRDTTQLMPGDRVSTTLLHGIFESQVTQLIHQQ
jgi:exodeoxyribonuclease VII large subunit